VCHALAAGSELWASGISCVSSVKREAPARERLSQSVLEGYLEGKVEVILVSKRQKPVGFILKRQFLRLFSCLFVC